MPGWAWLSTSWFLLTNLRVREWHTPQCNVKTRRHSPSRLCLRLQAVVGWPSSLTTWNKPKPYSDRISQRLEIALSSSFPFVSISKMPWYGWSKTHCHPSSYSSFQLKQISGCSLPTELLGGSPTRVSDSALSKPLGSCLSWVQFLLLLIFIGV